MSSLCIETPSRLRMSPSSAFLRPGLRNVRCFWGYVIGVLAIVLAIGGGAWVSVRTSSLSSRSSVDAGSSEARAVGSQHSAPVVVVQSTPLASQQSAAMLFFEGLHPATASDPKGDLVTESLKEAAPALESTSTF